MERVTGGCSLGHGELKINGKSVGFLKGDPEIKRDAMIDTPVGIPFKFSGSTVSKMAPGLKWPTPEQIKLLEHSWSPEERNVLGLDSSPDRLDAMAYAFSSPHASSKAVINDICKKYSIPTEVCNEFEVTPEMVGKEFGYIELTTTRTERLRAFLARAWSWLPSIRILAFSLVGLSFCLVDYSNPSPWWAPLSWALGTLCTLLLLNPAKDDDREWWQQ